MTEQDTSATTKHMSQFQIRRELWRTRRRTFVQFHLSSFTKTWRLFLEMKNDKTPKEPVDKGLKEKVQTPSEPNLYS